MNYRILMSEIEDFFPAKWYMGSGIPVTDDGVYRHIKSEFTRIPWKPIPNTFWDTPIILNDGRYYMSVHILKNGKYFADYNVFAEHVPTLEEIDSTDEIKKVAMSFCKTEEEAFKMYDTKESLYKDIDLFVNTKQTPKDSDNGIELTREHVHRTLDNIAL